MTNHISRRSFIGGSDARIIMGSDEAALVRLWQEKRGEVGVEDLSGNLIVQLGSATEDLNRAWYERNTGQRVTDVQRHVKHSAIPWMAATLDGIVLRSQVHAAVVVLGGSGGREVHGSAAAQHVGYAPALRRALDRDRGWQMGRDHRSDGPAVPEHSRLGR